MKEIYVRFVADLLEKKGYEIDFYRQKCFHAQHKENCLKRIEFSGENDEIEIYSDICFYSDGRSKNECIELFSNVFDETQKDIDFVICVLEKIEEIISQIEEVKL